MTKYVIYVEMSEYPYYSGYYERDGWGAPFLVDDYANAEKYHNEGAANSAASSILSRYPNYDNITIEEIDED